MSEPTPVSHEDIMLRLDQGNRRFLEIETQLRGISDSLLCLPAMRADIMQTRDIVEAWVAVKLMGKFVKWAAGIIAALVAIAVAVKAGIAHVVK